MSGLALLPGAAAGVGVEVYVNLLLVTIMVLKGIKTLRLRDDSKAALPAVRCAPRWGVAPPASPRRLPPPNLNRCSPETLARRT